MQRDATTAPPARRTGTGTGTGAGAGTGTGTVDSLVHLTHRVFDEKAIGCLYDLYDANVRVVGDDGLAYGRDHVIEDTTQLLAAFPDLRCHTDAVVSCGDEDTGFRTSHRVTLSGRNTGWSPWGPPTGRRIVVSGIADRFSRGGRIREEYLLHDTASLVRQLGHDPPTLGRRTATAPSSSPFAQAPEGEVERLLGPAGPRRLPDGEPGVEAGPRRLPDDEPRVEAGPERLPDDEPGVEAFVRHTLHDVFNRRRLDRIAERYAAGFRFHGPDGRELVGPGDYAAYVLGVLAMFPDAAHGVDDVYVVEDDRGGHVVAVRWELTGTHRGPGPYGAPTGRRVRHWGLTHVAVRDGLIAEEWTVSNELDVLRQLHAPRSRQP